MAQKIVVTGASGNVGSGVVRVLAAESPNSEIVGICRRPPALGPECASVRWRRIDLSESNAVDDLRSAMQGAAVVIHLAVALRPTGDHRYLRRVNVGGTEAVLRAAASAEVPQLIYASSLAVYSPGDASPVTEDWPRLGQASSTYSRNKITAEVLVDDFVRDHPEVSVAVIRPTLVVQRASAWQVRTLYLGPFVPQGLLRLVSRRKLPVVPLPAGTALQFVHADDVGQAVLQILRRRAQGSFNLAADVLDARELAGLVGGRPIAVDAGMFRTVVAVLHAARLIAVTPGWYDVATKSPAMDTDRARRELGWLPTKSSAECVTELIDGLAAGSVGTSAAMGASADVHARRRAWDVVHDTSLLLWTAATALRAAGLRRAGYADAAFVIANLLAGTPAALDRWRERRRDPVAVLAPPAVLTAVATTVRGGWLSLVAVAVLDLLAAAERRRRRTASGQLDNSNRLPT